MKRIGLTRVLALDLHPRRFGYVVVEGSNMVLDWGVRSQRLKSGSADVLIRNRLRPLLELWRPSVFVLRAPSRRQGQNLRAGTLLRQRIATELKKHRVPIRTITKTPGGGQGKRLTHYENAQLVTEHFPALKWSLPTKRKPWESDDYRMSMFSAAALAETYLRQRQRLSP